MIFKRYIFLFAFFATLSVIISLFYVHLGTETKLEKEPFEWTTINGDNMYLDDLYLSGSIQQYNSLAINSYLFEAPGGTIQYSDPLSILERYDSTGQPDLDRIIFKNRSLFRGIYNSQLLVAEDEHFIAAVHEEYDPISSSNQTVVTSFSVDDNKKSRIQIESPADVDYSWFGDGYIKNDTLFFTASLSSHFYNEQNDIHETEERSIYYAVDLKTNTVIETVLLDDLLQDYPSSATITSIDLFSLHNTAVVTITNEMDAVIHYATIDLENATISILDYESQQPFQIAENEQSLQFISYDTETITLYEWEKQTPEQLELIATFPSPFQFADDSIQLFHVNEQLLYILTNEETHVDSEGRYTLYTVGLNDEEILYTGEMRPSQQNVHFSFQVLKSM